MKFKIYRNVVKKKDTWLFFLKKDFSIDKIENILDSRILYKGLRSYVIEIEHERSIALKLIKHQVFLRDMIRKYFLSQAKREMTASYKLKELGLSCPEIFGYAVSLSPFAKYESILFVEYKKNLLTGYEFLKKEKDVLLRKKFLSNIAEDIIRIYNNSYHNKDCRFGNMLVGENLKPIWIDNDLRKIENFFLNKYLDTTFKHLKKRSPESLSNEEWTFFCNNIKINLSKYESA